MAASMDSDGVGSNGHSRTRANRLHRVDAMDLSKASVQGNGEGFGRDHHPITE